MKTIIKHGTIINADNTIRSDILVDGEKIVKIDEEINTYDAQVIDASGKLILPGGVDAHVHLDLPMFGTVSSDDHYTGGKAAAYGGTTTLIDFVPQEQGSLGSSIERWHNKADNNACIDFGFHMNITRFNQEIASEMEELPLQGITSVKVFTAYNNRLRLSDGDIFKVMRITRRAGILTMLHAENGDVIDILVDEALAQGYSDPIWHARTRPAWGAVEASLRAIALAAQAEAPLYLVHMNAAGEVDQLQYARGKGLPVMGETCPQYLFFTEDQLKLPDGAKWICSPPMRTSADSDRLWQGLKNGIILNIATDHCPFFYDGSKAILYENELVKIPGKELGKADFTKIPNGLPGVGDRMPIMWTRAVQEGFLTANQFVAAMSTNPARIFGLFPRKGIIQVGSDADIVIWDPNKLVNYGVAVAKHRTDYNLYEGWKLKGYPETVLLRGNKIVDNGNWSGIRGGGKFLYRLTGEIL